VRFITQSNAPIPLVPGYSGLVSFSDTAGHRIWTAWAVTTYQVKITRCPMAGDTVVCGKAPPNIADGQGSFCTTVSRLFKGQVILAEAAGTFSQPVVVGDCTAICLPLLSKP